MRWFDTPLRCMIGFHVGWPECRNGDMGFYCTRCEGWHPDTEVGVQ